jgi:uncharacterized membrane protein
MFVFIIWRTCRFPPTCRAAWTMTTVWAIALVLPGISIILNPARGLDLSIWVGWSNVICILLDGYMLANSILGLRWIYSREKSDTLSV